MTSLAIDAPGEILHAGIDGGAVAELFLTPDRLPVQPPPSGHRTRQLTPRWLSAAAVALRPAAENF